MRSYQTETDPKLERLREPGEPCMCSPSYGSQFHCLQVLVIPPQYWLQQLRPITAHAELLWIKSGVDRSLGVAISQYGEIEHLAFLRYPVGDFSIPHTRK